MLLYCIVIVLFYVLLLLLRINSLCTSIWSANNISWVWVNKFYYSLLMSRWRTGQTCLQLLSLFWVFLLSFHRLLDILHRIAHRSLLRHIANLLCPFVLCSFKQLISLNINRFCVCLFAGALFAAYVLTGLLGDYVTSFWPSDRHAGSRCQHLRVTQPPAHLTVGSITLADARTSHDDYSPSS